MQKKYMIINQKDNVAVAFVNLNKNDVIEINVDNQRKTFVLLDHIPTGHKFCIKEIQNGNSVIKFGEVIGHAVEDIHEGQWVHDHNIQTNYTGDDE